MLRTKASQKELNQELGHHPTAASILPITTATLDRCMNLGSCLALKMIFSGQQQLMAKADVNLLVA